MTDPLSKPRKFCVSRVKVEHVSFGVELTWYWNNESKFFPPFLQINFWRWSIKVGMAIDEAALLCEICGKRHDGKLSRWYCSEECFKNWCPF